MTNPIQNRGPRLVSNVFLDPARTVIPKPITAVDRPVTPARGEADEALGSADTTADTDPIEMVSSAGDGEIVMLFSPGRSVSPSLFGFPIGMIFAGRKVGWGWFHTFVYSD